MCVVYTGEKMGLKLRSFFTKFWNRAERPSRMVLTVTEDTPADMLAGSMELLVQLPREHHQQTQRVTVQRSTPMMDLLVQIATAHKLTASSYTLQAIGEHGIVLPHQPNTPIGALDALQVKLLPKQGTFVPRKTKQANQPFETTFRLQVHLPRNQLYVSRVSPKMNLGDILDEVCREKNLDRSKYELRHPASLETLDLSLSLQDYNLQEVTLYAKQGRTLGSALSTQDIMVLHRQEERRRQQAKQGVFGFVFKKSKESSLSTDSLGGRSASPARSDETGRSTSPLQPPARPQRKRRPAPKPPMDAQPKVSNSSEDNPGDSCKDKVVISHSRNSSDSSGYHEASVLSDNPDSAGRLPETLPRRSRLPVETSRKLAHTSQSSKSLSNLATVPGTLSHGISSTSLSSTGLRKKRAAPPPPATRPLSSAISTQALERIVDSEESLTSDIDPSKPPSDIGAPSKANSDIEDRPKANSDIGVTTLGTKIDFARPEPSKVDVEIKMDIEPRHRSGSVNVKLPSDQPGNTVPVTDAPVDARLPRKRDSNLSETDVLLQKVSDTLSNSLPVSTAVEVPITRFVSPVGAKSGTTCKETPSPSIKKTPNEQDLKQQSNEFPDGAIVNTSTPNLTVNSQQDTSDYVSAADEDLSIADWEYQLPAPPSAFRDSASPVFDNFDEVISSPDSFRDAGSKEQTDRDLRNSLEKQETRTESKGTSEKEVRKEIFHEKLQRQPRSDCNLKKEVICELENKISTLPQGTKDFDSRKAIENSLTAKIAPVDKTLSNFTITTYTRQKSLNVFEEVQDQSRRRNNDERFIKSFATLSRNKSNLDETEDRAAKEISTGTLQGKKEVEDTDHAKLEQPKMQTESLHRWQSGNEKSNIQRSKSYMSVCDKPKFQEATCEDEVVRNNNNMVNMDNVGLKKATSITSLNATRSNNEKFSQWRDNILKRQEEPTKEKQLQSLQVLKSILPQLKNAQQAEENVSKESSDDMVVLPEKTRPETTSNERSIELNVVSTRSEGKSEPEQRKPPSETSSKRYTYSGPPAISLGSWSERPTVNVQIKMDKDYKLGTLKSNNRTIVNINGTRDEADGCNEESRRPRKVLEKSNQIEIVTSDRREPNELAKKLITHTTATGFKRPVLNKVYIESKSTNEKPVVTGVELKKSFLETKQSDDTIDTTPVNFKEVSKAFGQEICLRPKPKRITLNRRSDLQIENDSNKQNGHVHPETVRATNDQYLSNGSLDTSKPKKFTSVVGVNPSNQGNFSFGNRIGAKAGAAPPVIKGFRITNGKGDQDNENNRKETFKESSIPQPPRPPTMPVITGVTLKSTRPKSMPVQVDPRDTLLESIRNFGGRENLKSVSILT
ncbi:PREDICTED: protein cordon-bleu isoform X8 [Dufourea novaeangliae]|uniref:protein cordon-bleu isoform X8 n=1 Tax=Dufourea novaeangliae TaxID=178035 RepID=UPI000767238E|nr:PREDICTED: protein cordon-bleu isoform X8 [Dufourea novaeangliae]